MAINLSRKPKFISVPLMALHATSAGTIKVEFKLLVFLGDSGYEVGDLITLTPVLILLVVELVQEYMLPL